MVGAVLIAAFMLFPLYWTINVSLEPTSDLFRIPPIWFPWHVTWAGYREAVQLEGGHFLTSFLVALGVVVVTIAVAAPAGYALGRFTLRGSSTVSGTVLVVQMIPAIVLANAFYGIFNHLHLLNSYPGLILADSTYSVPFGVILLRAFMSTLPTEVLEAGVVDGASQFRLFRSVALPLSRNSVITVSLFAFLGAWGDFLFAVTLNTSGGVVPVTVGIYEFIGFQTTNWNAVMATSVLTSIPAILLLGVAQRFVSAGITAGSVK